MATSVSKIQTIYEDVLANYLISMARTVEASVGCALDALLRPNQERAAALASNGRERELSAARARMAADQAARAGQ